SASLRIVSLANTGFQAGAASVATALRAVSSWGKPRPATGRWLQRACSRLPCAFAEELGDIKIDEIGMMENDRFDRALDLVALVAVRRDDVQDFARNAVFIGERDAAERVAHLLAESALNHFS